MRRMAFIIILLVGTIGGFEWLSRGFSVSWEPALRAYLESTASRLTKTNVHIDSIMLASINRVRLVNVRVTEPDDASHPIFQAEQIELTVSFIDLPRALYRRRPYEVIGLITLENPWIRLSKATMARHRTGGGTHSAFALPPWFTLAWKGGSFQWLDPLAPHKAWTLYQSQGEFRIRGPERSLTVEGGIEEARVLRLQITSLVHHWNARLSVTDGQTQGVLTFLQAFTQRLLLPAGWTVRGGFAFEARASGRRWPERGDRWSEYLDRATLTLTRGAEESKTAGPALGLAGTLLYKPGVVTGTHLAFDTPYADGKGTATLELGPAPGQSPMTLSASLTTGHIGKWPFEDASLHWRYQEKQWTLEETKLRFLNGIVTAKGTASAEGSDLSITAQDVSLAALGSERSLPLPQGSLNATCTLKGPPHDWQLAGAWWLTAVQWGHASLGDARGDFEITPQRFDAQAKSDHSPFRVALSGTMSDKMLEVEQLEVALPSGATFSGEGKYTRARRQILGTFEAAHVAIPGDVPLLPLASYDVAGTLAAEGRLTGSADEPKASMTLKSGDLSVQGQGVGDSTADILWDKKHYEISSFHLGPGIEGRFAKGEGTVKIQNAAIGRWSFTKGAARFTTGHGRFDLAELSLDTKGAALRGHALTTWEQDEGARTHYNVQGDGHLRALKSAEPWDVPFDFAGHFLSDKAAHEGELKLSARVLDGTLKGRYVLSGQKEHPEGRFTATLENAHWRAFPISSDIEAAWSREGIKPLVLKGRFKTGGTFEFNGLLSADAQANGTLKLDGFTLRPLGESLHFPKPLDGTARATLTLSGPVSQLHWTGHLEGGPFTYAAASEHPFKMEKVAMDLSLAPLDADPTVARLTVNEGEASTAEELMRFLPGSYVEFAGDRPARMVLGAQIRNLHLGIFTLFGGLDVDGTWQIKPEGFAIQTKAHTHSLFINDYELEEGLVLIDYYNGVLKFPQPSNAPALATGTVDFHKAPQLKFTDFFISGKDQQGLQLTGQIGPSLWDFQMAGRGLDLGTLGELSGFPYPLSGSADVQVHGTGDPAHPHVSGSVDLQDGTALGLAYRSGSAAFVWQNARITFQKLLLTDPGHYTLEGTGVFPLEGKAERRIVPNASRAVDFSLRLRDSNLGLLQSFSSEVKQAKGAVDGLIQIKGTIDDPELHGSLRVTDGEILGAHYFRQLRGGNLALEFNGNTVSIKDLRGKSGQGEFRGSGTIVLAGFLPAQYDLQLDVVSSKGVEVEVPELAIPESPLAKRFKFLTTSSRADVRGHAALSGPAEAPTFSGDALISNGHFTFPPSHKHPPNPAILEWFRRITWNVNLKFQDNAWFDNEYVQANVVGNLALKGPSDKLQVNGGLDINEGKISYLGLQFDIQQAHYDVRSDVSGDTVVNTPYVRGIAESQTQAVDTVSGVAGGGSRLSVNDTITLNIDYAPVDQIKPRLTSAANPNMSQDKLLARVTQTDVDNLTPQERNYLYQKQLVSLIDSSLTTPLAQNVLKKTGLADRLRVERVYNPNAAPLQDLNNPNASVQQQSTAVNLFANTKYTIEKDLNSRLSLGYGVRLMPSVSADPELQQQKLDLISDLQLSYRWFRNVYLRGNFDLPSSNPYVLPERKVTIEPRWRFGWWGNTNKDKVAKPPQ